MDKIPLKKAVQFEKTRAALGIITDSLKQIYKVSNVILQLLMIAYYTYGVIASVNGSTHTLIFKSVMLLLVVVGFVAGRVIDNKKKKNKSLKKSFKRSIKYAKLTLRIVTVAFSIYELTKSTPSQWDIILAITAIAGIALQFLLEIVTYLCQKYISLIRLGIEMDIEDIKNTSVAKLFDGATNIKATAIDMLDKPLAVIAKKKETVVEVEQPTEQPTVLRDKNGQLKQQLLLRASADGDKRQQEVDLKKEQRRQQKKQRAKNSWEKLKQHWRDAFGKKKKK